MSSVQLLKPFNAIFLIISVCLLLPSQSYCMNENVRVSISDNSFQKFSYQNISVFCTKECQLSVRNEKNSSIPIRANSIVKIEINNGVLIAQNDWKVIANTNRPNSAILLSSKNGMFGVSGLKRCDKQALYRGSFEIVKHTNSEFFLINILPLEDYLKGVVPNEMPVKFGISALKAQSVAARNYAIHERITEFKEFDLFDSVSSQVYFGYNTENEVSNKAILETRGIVMTSNGKTILARYHSTSGGCTENSENVFSDLKTNKFPGTPDKCLLGRRDFQSKTDLSIEKNAREFYTSTPKSFESESKYFRWKYEWAHDDLIKILRKTIAENARTGFVNNPNVINSIDKITDIKVKRRGVSGKIMEVDIVTNAGVITIKKELIFRKIFLFNGKILPSANVVFSLKRDHLGNLSKITAYGGGFGHGVGMSQYGAAYMGQKLKLNFVQILKRYYSNISISTIPLNLKSEVKSKNKFSFFAPTKKARLAFYNIIGNGKVTISINGKLLNISLDEKSKSKKLDISSYLLKGQNAISVQGKTTDMLNATFCIEFL